MPSRPSSSKVVDLGAVQFERFLDDIFHHGSYENACIHGAPMCEDCLAMIVSFTSLPPRS